MPNHKENATDAPDATGTRPRPSPGNRAPRHPSPASHRSPENGRLLAVFAAGKTAPHRKGDQP